MVISPLSIHRTTLVENESGKKKFHKNSFYHLNLADYKMIPATLLSLA